MQQFMEEQHSGIVVLSLIGDNLVSVSRVGREKQKIASRVRFTAVKDFFLVLFFSSLSEIFVLLQLLGSAGLSSTTPM